MEFRFPPSWTLFEPRCINQQLPVTSYRQSLAGVLMFSPLRTFVYHFKILKVLILKQLSRYIYVLAQYGKLLSSWMC